MRKIGSYSLKRGHQSKEKELAETSKPGVQLSIKIHPQHPLELSEAPWKMLLAENKHMKKYTSCIVIFSYWFNIKYLLFSLNNLFLDINTCLKNILIEEVALGMWIDTVQNTFAFYFVKYITYFHWYFGIICKAFFHDSYSTATKGINKRNKQIILWWLLCIQCI